MMEVTIDGIKYTITGLPMRLNAANMAVGRNIEKGKNPDLSAEESLKVGEELDLLLPKIFEASCEPKTVSPKHEYQVWDAIQVVTQLGLNAAECFRQRHLPKPSAEKGSVSGIDVGGKTEPTPQSRRQ